MGIAFAAELLFIACLFVLLNAHLARTRMKEKVYTAGHHHDKKENLMRAIHAHNMCLGYSSLGVAMTLYLWIQGIHATFAIIYGGMLCLGVLSYAYSVLVHEVWHKKNWLGFRIIGGTLSVVSIFAASLTALIALF